MRNTNEPKAFRERNADDKLNFEQMIAQLRQDQLDAALAGRMAESAFYAAEARALREEFEQESALCA